MLARSLSLVVAGSFFAVPFAPAGAVAPISAWKIEPSEMRCVATRQYGTDEKPITLALKVPPTGSAMQIAIIRQAYRNSSSQAGATVDMDGKSFKTFALGYPLGFPARTSKQTVSLIHLSTEASAAMRLAGNLGVNIKGSPDDVFPLGDMAGTWASMAACLDRLRKTWNIEQSGSAMATPPEPTVPISGMISPRDFPPQATAQVWHGTTSFLLLIDEKGAVKDCTLTESSGIAVIDSRTCAIISYKARFKPALGPNGNVVKSAFAQRITWAVK